MSFLGSLMNKLLWAGTMPMGVGGSFRPNGNSGIVAGSERGVGWSVARDDVGEYIITFDEPLLRPMGFHASVRVADGTPTIVQFGDYSAANRTLVLRVLQETADVGGDNDTQFEAVDLADDEDNVISFFVLSEESQARVR